MKLITKLPLLISLIVLQSCSHNQSAGDAKSNSILQAALSQCENSAKLQFPPKMATRVKTSVAPVATRTTIEPPPSSRVRVTESYAPVQGTELYDENIQPRESAVKKCMQDNQLQTP